MGIQAEGQRTFLTVVSAPSSIDEEHAGILSTFSLAGAGCLSLAHIGTIVEPSGPGMPHKCASSMKSHQTLFTPCDAPHCNAVVLKNMNTTTLPELSEEMVAAARARRQKERMKWHAGISVYMCMFEGVGWWVGAHAFHFTRLKPRGKPQTVPGGCGTARESPMGNQGSGALNSIERKKRSGQNVSKEHRSYTRFCPHEKKKREIKKERGWGGGREGEKG
eukprot:1159934-Pelagomonas_calceolata.AAC.3